MAKTWAQKLNNGAKPIVGPTERSFAGIAAGMQMLVPTPALVKEYMEAIPRGKTATIEELRQDLAKAYNADVTCPLVTGIFVRIVAEAALDEHRSGKALSEITPFWRVLDEKSKAGKKLTCGTDFLAEMRRAESQ
jgi:hypothetical protein